MRALASLKLDPEDRPSSHSPPMSLNNNNSNSGMNTTPSYPCGPYPGVPSPPMSLLTPGQLLAANHTAAALMAAGLPVSSLFAHHTLFGGWPTAHNTSPPPQPQTPIKSGKKSMLNLNNNNNNNDNNNEYVRLDKKTLKRKAQPRTVLAETPPLSPPTSGSSPDTAPTLTKDPSRDKTFTCKVCSRSFGYKHVLQNHERTHTGEKPFSCTECGKRFTRDHHLKTHMRLHTGEKPYHCSYCERQFVQVANLRRHILVHTKERPYGCELCQAKFADSNQLKAHALTHAAEVADRPLKGARKSVDVRRVVRPPPITKPLAPLLVTACSEPEQTEPEDLSVGARNHSLSSAPDSSLSPVSMSDPEDLDDAAALYLQQRQAKLRRHMEHR